MDWGSLLQDTGSPSYPIIKKVVEDLQRDYAAWYDKLRDFEFATVNSTAAEPDEKAELLQQELQSLAVDIESYVAELNYLGVRIDVHDLFGELR